MEFLVMSCISDDPYYASQITSQPLLELGKSFEKVNYDTGEVFHIHLFDLEAKYNWNVDLYVIDRRTLFEGTTMLWDSVSELLIEKAKSIPQPDLTDKEKAERMVTLIDRLKEIDALDYEEDAELVKNGLYEETILK